MIFRLETSRQNPGRTGGLVVAGHAGVIMPPAGPLEFSRFLLASVGLHLMLGFVVMMVGLHQSPVIQRPLVVRLVETEAPKPAPAPARPARARSPERVGPQAATEPAAPKELSQLKAPAPSAARANRDPSTAIEMLDRTPPDELRQIASQRAARELVRDLGQPLRTSSLIAERTSGPKSIGALSGVVMAPGTEGREALDSGPALIGLGSEGGGRGTSPGDSGKGAPRSLTLPLSAPAGVAVGKVGGGGGPRVIGGGATVAIPSSGISSGPSLVGAVGGDPGSEQVSRAGAGRSGMALAVPLAQTVTVGLRRGAVGRGSDGGGLGAPGGKFAAPKYGVNPLPAYPPLAREKGYEGTVYLRVLVQSDGRVGKLTIDRSSGHEILDRAAMDSVKEWTFDPARRGGRPVESWVLLPLKFMLD